jgi:hypothetical protein
VIQGADRRQSKGEGGDILSEVKKDAAQSAARTKKMGAESAHFQV